MDDSKKNEQLSAAQQAGKNLRNLIQKASQQEHQSQYKDDYAEKEQQVISSEGSSYGSNYQKETEKAQEHREEETRTVFHRMFLWFLKVAALCILLILIVRVWHLIGFPGTEDLPLKWLEEDQLNDIDRMLFSGMLGGLLSRYLESIFNGNKK